jgi:hypothetical protein
VVRDMPSLGGISIWNELDGKWNGGIADEAQRLEEYCQLTNAVITAVRKVNAKIPIAIEATRGWDIDDWFTGMFDKYGCIGKGDPTIRLDVHPYLFGKKNPATHKTDWQLRQAAISNIRKDGIANPLIATEWAPAAPIPGRICIPMAII